MYVCVYIYIDVPQFLSGPTDVAAYRFFTPEDQVSSLFSHFGHFACLDS